MKCFSQQLGERTCNARSTPWLCSAGGAGTATGLLGSESPIPPLPKAGCSWLCPLSFWLSPRLETRQPAPVVNHPFSKKAFSYVQVGFVFFFTSICASHPAPGLRRVQLCLLYSPHQVSAPTDGIPLSLLLQAEQSQLSASPRPSDAPSPSSS